MSKTRRNHTPEFKAQVVLELLREESTVNELAARHQISPVLISRWKAELMENATEVFRKGSSDADQELSQKEGHIADFECKVGQLTVGVNFLIKNLLKLSTTEERLVVVERCHKTLTVKKQCQLLSVNRSSAYQKLVETNTDIKSIEVMNAIAAIHTDHPTLGYRKITDILRKENIINKKRVQWLMREMDILTIYPKPNFSKRYHSQYVRPYLLRNLKIVRPNQVWGVDITYVKMKKGFMYLFIIIDWYSRCIVDYELSSTLEKSFVIIV